ncbi:MAG TPA: DegV family protein [Chloroflexota bacterium]|nr:DegV family protein [Chloroflexota bacterium]
MVRVRVVTDSTADMDMDEAQRLGVTIVPLRVRWDGESYRDKIELSIDAFYEKLKAEKGVPRTSQPSAGEFEDAYRRLLEEAEGVVSIHISGGLSGTVNTARLMANSVDPDRIAVIDSMTTSYSQGSTVLKVARLAADGAPLSECVALAEDLVPRLRLFCVLDTLEFIRRGGRIGRAQAIAGTLLSIKPIVHLHEGSVYPSDRVRTRGAAVRRCAELVRELGPLEDAAALYGDNPEPAEQLRELLQRDHPELEVKLGRTGSTLGTHTGPGVFAACAVLAR